MRTRRPLRPVFSTPSYAPIATLNTTPLIDVMLVLLIMFIITVPVMTHSVKIDLPSGPVTDTTEPEVHQLGLDQAGRLSWDGAAIAETALPGRLAAFRAARPDGILHFRTDGRTRYEDFDRVLATVKRARIERLGFLGNEAFADAFDG
jgi:biopolymer transport protein ExbD